MNTSEPASIRCASCATELAQSRLDCPACGTLVHAPRLKELAAEAERREAAADLAGALAAWQSVPELLPPGTRQYERIASIIARLQHAVAAAGAASGSAVPKQPSEKRHRRGAWAAGLGAAGLLLWKLKTVALLLLTKLKFLALGLTKAGTFFSMFLSLGVYWAAFGWRFAAGLIASLYVHEMGHVAALRRHHIPATAPMFIPGLGAFVRLKQHLTDPALDAAVGLAGPRWGTAAALACYFAGKAAGWPSLLAIAHVGAWINLFNLLPVWQLDGGRAFAAMTRGDRLWAAGALVLLWGLGSDGLVLLLAIAAAARAFTSAPPAGVRRVLVEYVGLAAVLTLLARA